MSAVIARRYARAFFNAAVARKATEALRNELEAVATAAHICSELLPVLTDEELAFAKRGRLVDALATPLALSPLSVNFLKVLIQRHRMVHFADVVAAYQQLVAEMEGTVTAEVTTAVRMVGPEVVQGVEAAVARFTHRKVLVTARIDPGLIGGIVVRVGDEIYDGSVTAELQRVKERLLHL